LERNFYCPLHTAVHGLRVFVDRMVRKIFGFKREVTGGCRTLHIEELHNVYSLQILLVRDMGNECEVLIRKPKGKR
jgi:hypothetical protein